MQTRLFGWRDAIKGGWCKYNKKQTEEKGAGEEE